MTPIVGPYALPDCIPRAGKTLIVGSKVYKTREDRRPLFADAIGLDIESGDGVDIVHDLEIPFEGAFDHVECISVLEHVKRPWLAAANIEGAMVLDATIFVSVPWVWRYHNYGGDFYRFSADAIPILFPHIDWKSLAYFSESEGITQACPRPKNTRPFLIPRTEVYAFGVKS